MGEYYVLLNVSTLISQAVWNGVLSTGQTVVPGSS